MYKKKVSILLATYNGSKYVHQQIDSIALGIRSLTNEYDFNVFISDDASSDNTVEIIKGLSEKHKFLNLIDSERKGGVKNNFLFLVNNIPDDSDYMFFCDQDDFWLPNKLKLFLDEFIERDSNVPLLLHSDLTVVDECLFPNYLSMFDSQKLNKNATFNELITQNNVTGCVMAINKSAFKLIKDVDFTYSIMHDWYIALYVSFYGEIYFIDKPTILYRQHSNNQVGAKQLNISSLLQSFRNFPLLFESARDSVNKTKAQAKLFYTHNSGENSHRLKELKSFIDSFEQSWIKRLRCFFVYGFRKHSIIRNFVFFFVYVFWNFEGE
ncbi:glycosyltransferase family 2 protein [Scandinavium sp. TWS1a]|uniref:glycosyltransferase family 2 protein n=1 Tax=Scandinavium tedordense TaxID=2926521 RepID=UPI002166AE92|nr:glycosyltransferase family 2 protein [Scandinavium tedordense]MCS2171729.1 glycosyltransferase family 2 protein [Scandinavium tedordense]